MRKLIVAAMPGVFALVLLASVSGCDTDSGPHRVGDAYERNNMPSADPDRPAGPHNLSDDAGGDHEMLHQSR